MIGMNEMGTRTPGRVSHFNPRQSTACPGSRWRFIIWRNAFWGGAYSLVLCPAPVQLAGRHFDGSHLAGSHFDRSHLVGSHLVGSQEAVFATGPAGVPGWVADANTAVPVCSTPVNGVAAAPFACDLPAAQTALQAGLG